MYPQGEKGQSGGDSDLTKRFTRVPLTGHLYFKAIYNYLVSQKQSHFKIIFSESSFM